MKYKIIYKTNEFYFEAEASNEQERKEAVKGLIYAVKDLTDSNLLNPNTERVPILDQKQEIQNPQLNSLGNNQNTERVPILDQKQGIQEQPVIEYASEGQKKYMAKLGIEFDETTTKIEAIDLINGYKIAHGIPVGKRI